jgi:hypothetical protein
MENIYAVFKWGKILKFVWWKPIPANTRVIPLRTPPFDHFSVELPFFSKMRTVGLGEGALKRYPEFRILKI